jgi:hypothetical protein
MRLENELPINETEKYIESVLIDANYELENIQFNGSMNKDGGRYLRVNYWSKLKLDVRIKLADLIKEDSFYDDDCGYLFVYQLKNI